MGPRGWYLGPLEYQYWGWGRCRRFPWLPRWWWTGIHGPLTPYAEPYWVPPMSKEGEIAMLEEEEKMLGQELTRIRKRLEELGK